MSLRPSVVAEAIGTALLLATVVGSGIMGERLAGGNVAIALLANTLATGAVLVALIATFGPTSGAHFNPLVTLAERALGRCRWRKARLYLAAQVLGAVAGVIAAQPIGALLAVVLIRWAHGPIPDTEATPRDNNSDPMTIRHG